MNTGKHKSENKKRLANKEQRYEIMNTLSCQHPMILQRSVHKLIM